VRVSPPGECADICNRNGIEFETVEMGFADRDAAMLWMIDNQKGRRNLADIDLIALERKRESILRPLAKEQQIRKSESVSAKLPKQNAIDTRKECAKAAGVGGGVAGCQKSDKVVQPVDTKRELAAIAGVSTQERS
jgi:hypothetical protein